MSLLFRTSCRAKVSDDCEDGEITADPMDDDGTYDGATIVCGACYGELMDYSPSRKLLTHEIARAIQEYRDELEVREAFGRAQARAMAAQDESVKAGRRRRRWIEGK